MTKMNDDKLGIRLHNLSKRIASVAVFLYVCGEQTHIILYTFIKLWHEPTVAAQKWKLLLLSGEPKKIKSTSSSQLNGADLTCLDSSGSSSLESGSSLPCEEQLTQTPVRKRRTKKVASVSG
jgi:hypothetical protein